MICGAHANIGSKQCRFEILKGCGINPPAPDTRAKGGKESARPTESRFVIRRCLLDQGRAIEFWRWSGSRLGARLTRNAWRCLNFGEGR